MLQKVLQLNQQTSQAINNQLSLQLIQVQNPQLSLLLSLQQNRKANQLLDHLTDQKEEEKKGRIKTIPAITLYKNNSRFSAKFKVSILV